MLFGHATFFKYSVKKAYVHIQRNAYHTAGHSFVLAHLLCRVPGVVIFSLKKALCSISVGSQEQDFIKSYSQGQACGKSCNKLPPTIVLSSRQKNTNTCLPFFLKKHVSLQFFFKSPCIMSNVH